MLRFAGLILPLLLVTACESGGTTTNTVIVPQTGFLEPCAAKLKSQVMSEPCCPDFGLDACGAGLFCGAFDGRTQPTCYAEYSRKSGADCTEDRQCSSASCNPDVKKCRYLYGTTCTKDVGCTAMPNGTPTVCAAEDASAPDKFACDAVDKDSPFGEGCLDHTWCKSGLCDPGSSTCTAKAQGEPCKTGSECKSGDCYPAKGGGYACW